MAVAFALTSASYSRAQNPDTIPAAESAAKAKSILQETIAALGGPAYLNVRDSDCEGQLAQFGALTGQLTGYAPFHEYRMPPDKYRREVGKSKPIIDIYNGDKGWSLDKGGIEDTDAVVMAGFQSSLRGSFDNLMRTRLNEPGLYFHFGGEDVVDLKHADWAEISDSELRTFRIAVDRGTHLPIWFVVATRNADTREVTEDTTKYSNWHEIDGVQMPFQISRERDGKRLSQLFFISCKFNSGISPALFTRASLEERWKGGPPKKK